MTNEATRWFGVGDVLGDAADGQGRQAFGLEDVGYRTDRASAQGSDRSENDQVHLVFLQRPCRNAARR